MTWDSVELLDWAKAVNPSPTGWVLSYSTSGCGCCSNGDITHNAEKAKAVLTEHIQEREQELVGLRQLLEHVQKTGCVEPLHV